MLTTVKLESPQSDSDCNCNCDRASPLRSVALSIRSDSGHETLCTHNIFDLGLDAARRGAARSIFCAMSQSDIAIAIDIDMLKRALLSAPFRFRAYNSPHALKGPCPPLAMALRWRGLGLLSLGSKSPPYEPRLFLGVGCQSHH